MTNRKHHKWPRAALALPVVAVSLAFTGTASATTFQATVRGINPKPSPPCAATITTPRPTPTAVFCGSASIAGYGPAVWTDNVIAVGPTISGCFNYAAITTFQLLRRHSTLILDEGALDNEGNPTDAAQACAPGNSSSAPSHDWSVPLYANNVSWTVDSASTGVFAGLTGAGTAALQTAGAQFMGTYSGTLG
jgi:hypothetical protein